MMPGIAPAPTRLRSERSIPSKPESRHNQYYPYTALPQIMIIDASDMLANFSAVVNAVATFAGLPEHDFQYDPSHEHKTGCLEYDQRLGNNYFVPGGRCGNQYIAILN